MSILLQYGHQGQTELMHLRIGYKDMQKPNIFEAGQFLAAVQGGLRPQSVSCQEKGGVFVAGIDRGYPLLLLPGLEYPSCLHT